MHDLILWCGFVGAWLLVAGPVYQAFLELREEDVETDRLRALAQEVEPPDPISPWWWLLPPVRVLLGRARRERHKDRVLALMSEDQHAVMQSYVNKGFGWLLVALGGLLIATKETWELVEGVEWPHPVFWVLVVVMLSLALGNVVTRARHEATAVAARRVGR